MGEDRIELSFVKELGKEPEFEIEGSPVEIISVLTIMALSVASGMDISLSNLFDMILDATKEIE